MRGAHGASRRAFRRRMRGWSAAPHIGDEWR
jgi:hypothetical protein